MTALHRSKLFEVRLALASPAILSFVPDKQLVIPLKLSLTQLIPRFLGVSNLKVILPIRVGHRQQNALTRLHRTLRIAELKSPLPMVVLVDSPKLFLRTLVGGPSAKAILPLLNEVLKQILVPLGSIDYFLGIPKDMEVRVVFLWQPPIPIPIGILLRMLVAPTIRLLGERARLMLGSMVTALLSLEIAIAPVLVDLQSIPVRTVGALHVRQHVVLVGIRIPKAILVAPLGVRLVVPDPPEIP